ncbi:hypothetical protein A2699_04025 [Candidatus Gottesmanbacteria bacterium RIFCSPHIGHO2_01_FULL_43_15]|nr:MAG: hypothetical protein A2699_04025 [Candidatus Gottesmanbacteria bacterium RIFCSPHIGHO2_01_FULL_43_15]
MFAVLLPFVYLHFKSGAFFLTHDGPFHIERTFHFLHAFLEGNFWPTWGRFYNNGFGSPIFLFLFPVPYLIPTMIALAGIDFIAALKLSFLIFQALALIAMYCWLRNGLRFSVTSSLLGSIAYIYSPYVISAIFVRGVLRELAGLALAPFILFAIYQLFSQTTLQKVGWAALIFGLFFLTDGYSVILFFPIFFIYSLYLFLLHKIQKKFGLSVISAVILGGAISAFITLPTILELGYLKGVNNEVYKDHFVYAWQLIDPHWGFGFSMPGTNDSMSFQIGAINLVAISMVVFLLLTKKIKQDKLIIFFAILLVIFLILMIYHPLSLFVWGNLTVLKKVQFPWRFLAPVVLICSFFAAVVANKYRLRLRGLIILSLLIMMVSIKYLRTNQAIEYEYSYLPTNKSDATAFHEFIPKWRDSTSSFENITEKVEVVRGSANIISLVEKSCCTTFTVEARDPVNLRINTLYYPGWELYIDGKISPFTITNNDNKKLADNKRDISGLMAFELQNGTHNVRLQFADTPVRRSGKFISMIGIVISILLVLKHLYFTRVCAIMGKILA